MAKQTGLLRISGKVGTVQFVQTKDGDFVRLHQPLDKKRIANDPAFERTRENTLEFENVANSSKLIRDGIREMLLAVSDKKFHGRLFKHLYAVKNLDVISARGGRKVGTGLLTPEGKLELEGFDFNSGAVFSSILFSGYTVDPLTGVVTIQDLNPATKVVYPQGATHVRFQSCWTKLDFMNGLKDTVYSNIEHIVKNGPTGDVVLTPPAVPAGTGISMFVLLISFYQEVNGMPYAMKNGAHNSLSILAID